MAKHKFYSRAESAVYLDESVHTLDRLHYAGDGPAEIKLGNGPHPHRIYRRTALDRWRKMRDAKARAKARAIKQAAREAEKAREAETRFRQRIAEILSGALDFTIPDLHAVMARSGYRTIGSIPVAERETFLTALVDACMDRSVGG